MHNYAIIWSGLYILHVRTPYKALKVGTTTWMDIKKIFEIYDIYTVRS